jgi:putative ABC transport system ATP-binding protein
MKTTKDGPLVRLRGVVKKYRTGAGGFTALRDVSIDIHRGEFVAVIGKSGAGKSTLVNMITGVDALTAGEVWVGDTPVHALDENAMALWRGRALGVIYQTFELLPQLSLLDNVLLPMDLSGTYTPRASVERALELLARVGLADHVYKTPGKISGGQQQRVAIARALANDPDVIVADEPTGSLDSATAEDVWKLFHELVAQGKTIVMVTHDRSLAARTTRTLTLVDGVMSEG